MLGSYKLPYRNAAALIHGIYGLNCLQVAPNDVNARFHAECAVHSLAFGFVSFIYASKTIVYGKSGQVEGHRVLFVHGHCHFSARRWLGKWIGDYKSIGHNLHAPHVIRYFVDKICSRSFIGYYRRCTHSSHFLYISKILWLDSSSISVEIVLAVVEHSKILLVTHHEVAENGVLGIFCEFFSPLHLLHHLRSYLHTYCLAGSVGKVEIMRLIFGVHIGYVDGVVGKLCNPLETRRAERACHRRIKIGVDYVARVKFIYHPCHFVKSFHPTERNVVFLHIWQKVAMACVPCHKTGRIPLIGSSLHICLEECSCVIQKVVAHIIKKRLLEATFPCSLHHAVNVSSRRLRRTAMARLIVDFKSNYAVVGSVCQPGVRIFVLHKALGIALLGFDALLSVVHAAFLIII